MRKDCMLSDKMNHIRVTKPESTHDLNPSLEMSRGPIFKALQIMVLVLVLMLIVKFGFSKLRTTVAKIQIKFEHHLRTTLSVAINKPCALFLVHSNSISSVTECLFHTSLGWDRMLVPWR